MMRLALDGTPLLGFRSGVGEVVAGIAPELARRPEVELVAYALTLRGRHDLAARVPPGTRSATRRYPARLVRQALAEVGLEGAVKTSGAKGVHVFVPIDDQAPLPDSAAATRAIAARAERLDPETATTAFMKEDRGGKVFVDSTRVGGATVVAAYSPRLRPGVPVSFPVSWDDLDDIVPADFNVHTALRHLGNGDQWAVHMPSPQRLNPALIEEGHAIPVARVQAMHEGKRRARARRR